MEPTAPVNAATLIVGVEGVNDPTPPAIAMVATGLASPKSRSFAPDFVSMMLPGFRSR
jgi:hypothetical protein